MDIYTKQDLRDEIGCNVHDTLLYCGGACAFAEQLGAPVDLREDESAYGNWARRLQCQSCNDSWVVCIICSRSKTRFLKNSQMYDHHRRNHKPDEEMMDTLICDGIDYGGVIGTLVSLSSEMDDASQNGSNCSSSNHANGSTTTQQKTIADDNLKDELPMLDEREHSSSHGNAVLKQSIDDVNTSATTSRRKIRKRNLQRNRTGTKLMYLFHDKSSKIKLRMLVGNNVPDSQLYCQKCPVASQLGVLMDVSAVAPKFRSWARKLRCERCTHEWSICVRCTHLKDHFDEVGDLSFHNRKWHGRTTMKQQEKRKASNVGTFQSPDVIDHGTTMESIIDVPERDAKNFPDDRQKDQYEPSNKKIRHLLDHDEDCIDVTVDDSSHSDQLYHYDDDPNLYRDEENSIRNTLDDDKDDDISVLTRRERMDNGGLSLVVMQNDPSTSNNSQLCTNSIKSVTGTEDVTSKIYSITSKNTDANVTNANKPTTSTTTTGIITPPSNKYNNYDENDLFHVDSFSSQKSRKYFEMEYKGLGPAYLVSRSQFELKSISDGYIRDMEVELQLLIATLLCDISVGNKRKLVSMLKLYERVLILRQQAVRARENGEITSLRHWETQVPVDMAGIRRIYLEGAHALIPNLPRPRVRVLQNHSYVSLIDCIEDLLAHGVELDMITDDTTRSDRPIVSWMSESYRAREILTRAKSCHNFQERTVLCFYVNEWSDGFEPSRSIKGNRGSAWVKTVTIAPPRGHIHSIVNTFPIAIGKGDCSHEEVERCFAEELEKLRNGPFRLFYHGGLQRNVAVHVELFASLMDQPERRKANFIMLGNSTFSARWGYAADLSAVASGIPACQSCFKRAMKGEDMINSDCRDCTNWETNVARGILDFEPPEDYPAELLPKSKKLRPIRLSYELMKGAVRTAHDNIVSDNWKVPNAKAYLRVYGINTEASAEILEAASNCRNFLLAETNRTTAPKRYELLLEQKQLHPELYQRWSFPALWDRGVELHQHIDVAMHLLFLGVIKTTMHKVQDWARKRGKFASFVRYANESAIQSVQSLRLDWCKLIPYKGGKLGGWVSENYMAMARILCWFYDPLPSLAEDDIVIDPEGDYQDWNKPQCKKWLSVRGLCIEGDRDEMKERIGNYMEQEDGPPSPLGQSGGSVDCVIQVLESLHAMVCRVMCRTCSDRHVADVDRHIKLFLSRFDEFDRNMKSDQDKTPQWLSSYNFICLTNLPAVLATFGPIRNLWEGGGQGEKMLQTIKPRWFGYRKNWQQNIIDNILKKQALRRICKKHSIDVENEPFLDDESDSDDDEGQENEERNDNEQIAQNTSDTQRNYVVYKAARVAVNQLSNRRPVSILQLSNGHFGMAVGSGGYLRLRFTGDDVEQTEGMCRYFVWRVSEEAVRDNHEYMLYDLDDADIVNYCMLLPKLAASGNPDNEGEAYYTLIQSEWKCLRETGEISFPLVTGATY